MGKGIFYAVSVGAGDPLDMTLRAKQVLEQADVVVAPVTKQGSASAAYTIAAQAADLSRAQIANAVSHESTYGLSGTPALRHFAAGLCGIGRGKAGGDGNAGGCLRVQHGILCAAAFGGKGIRDPGRRRCAVLLCRRSQGKAEPLRKREDAGNLARRGIPGSPGTGVRRIRQSGDYESRKGAVLAAAASGRTGTSGTHHNAPGCGHGIGICGQSPGRTVFLFYNPADSAERRMTWYILLVQAPETRNC